MNFFWRVTSWVVIVTVGFPLMVLGAVARGCFSALEIGWTIPERISEKCAQERVASILRGMSEVVDP